MTAPYSPDELSGEGKMAYKEKRYAEAADAFQAASQGYVAAGDPLSAAEMLNNQSVSLLMAGNAEMALQAASGTEETFAAAGDIRRQAMAFGNQGAALEKLARFDEAINAYEHANELFKQIGEHDLRKIVLESLSTLQMKTGRKYEAAATLKASMDEDQQPKPVRRFLKKLYDLSFKALFRS